MSGRLTQYPFTAPHPKNFAKGRQGYRPVWFVIHCTDTSYADNYPANLGNYWKNNAVQVSVHFAVSDTQTYQFVDMGDTAYQARNPANLRGVGVEIVGKAAWSRNEWLAHKLMLRRAAKLCAEVTLECGFKTDPVLLTAGALKARNSGLTCHRDLTNAFQGTHTDPGDHFPWDFFLIELRNALKPVKQEQQIIAATKANPIPQEQDVLMAVTEQEFDALVARVTRLNKQCDRLDDIIAGEGKSYGGSNLDTQLHTVVTELRAIGAKVDALSAKG